MPNTLNDNRETCTLTLPSSCIPYTGYVSPTIANTLACRPNVNDVLQQLQVLIDKINTNLGDNTALVVGCLDDLVPATITQQALNQRFITELCAIKAILETSYIDPNAIVLALDILCLLDPSCDPQAEYTLPDILNKLVVNYCNLLTRVQTIEQTLNI